MKRKNGKRRRYFCRFYTRFNKIRFLNSTITRNFIVMGFSDSKNIQLFFQKISHLEEVPFGLIPHIQYFSVLCILLLLRRSFLTMSTLKQKITFVLLY